MNIVILCTDPSHPVNESLIAWQLLTEKKGHEVRLEFSVADIGTGDILFLVSCSAIISAKIKRNFKAVLVLHASDLPKGRGWSPHIWAILAGENDITVCLLEASDPVDSGNIWLKKSFRLEGHELLDEIHEALFHIELELMTEAVEAFHNISPEKQIEAVNLKSEKRSINNSSLSQPSFSTSTLRKRKADDSCLDMDQSIRQQFNLLRVVDSERYPAYIDHLGQRYKITIEKING
ncbi:MAG: methionyl-tRNA formyltransferase [Marinobacter maritimus]|jgi:methionyl-tRNA formyltransferase